MIKKDDSPNNSPSHQAALNSEEEIEQGRIDASPSQDGHLIYKDQTDQDQDLDQDQDQDLDQDPNPSDGEEIGEEMINFLNEIAMRNLSGGGGDSSGTAIEVDADMSEMEVSDEDQPAVDGTRPRKTLFLPRADKRRRLAQISGATEHDTS